MSSGSNSYLLDYLKTLLFTLLPHSLPKEPCVSSLNSTLWSGVHFRKKSSSFLQLHMLRARVKGLDGQIRFFYLTRRLIQSIHTQNQFLWNTNPWARNNRKGLSLGKGFLKCLFRTFGIPSNTGPRTKGCLNQSECSQVQPHPSPPGRGFWTLTPSAPDAPSLAQGHRAGNQEESPTLLPPGPDLQALISTNSIWLPWGI